MARRTPASSSDVVTFASHIRVRLRAAISAGFALASSSLGCLAAASRSFPEGDLDAAARASGPALVAVVLCLSALADRDQFAPSVFGAKASALSLVACSLCGAALLPLPPVHDFASSFCLALTLATFAPGAYVAWVAWTRA